MMKSVISALALPSSSSPWLLALHILAPTAANGDGRASALPDRVVRQIKIRLGVEADGLPHSRRHPLQPKIAGVRQNS
jgi:hypothetical protein